jgi:AraC-like DNA-binding protein
LKIAIVIFLSSGNFLLAQTKTSTEKQQIKLLQKESYQTLEQEFWTALQNNSQVKTKYALAYLLKAKKEKDTLEIADAYYMMIYASHWKTSKVYVDSIITITKGNINYNQPAKAYILLANDFGTRGRYKEAFVALDEAYYCAISSGNIVQLYNIKYLIARLKTSIGDYQSSLNILRDVVSYYREKDNTRSYIIAYWAYGNNLNLLKKPDSVIQINKELISLSLKTRDSVIYNKLLLSSAISLYEKENYTSSLDSILKLNKLYKKTNNINSINVLINLYLAKIYSRQNKNELALTYLEKVDSISTSKNYFHSSIRENYTLMYHHYKENKDIKNQLYYINKLLKTDSILDNDFAYLVKNVNTKYATRNLISEKQKIIKSLNQSNFNNKIIFLLLLLLCIVFILFLIKNYKKKNHNQKRIQEINRKKKEQTHIIDDETTTRILDALHKIEQSDIFLKTDFNLAHLAKLLKTNTSYLSRIINKHKKQTFKQYLIDLRINYLIKELNEKPIIRKHSIEALATSIGYTNASSFTRIFKNHIGMSPSEYLKKNYSD